MRLRTLCTHTHTHTQPETRLLYLIACHIFSALPALPGDRTRSYVSTGVAAPLPTRVFITRAVLCAIVPAVQLLGKRKHTVPSKRNRYRSRTITQCTRHFYGDVRGPCWTDATPTHPVARQPATARKRFSSPLRGTKTLAIVLLHRPTARLVFRIACHLLPTQTTLTFPRGG